MLEPAVLYKGELNYISARNVIKPENKFYNTSYEIMNRTIQDDFYNEIQFVSIYKNKVIGYLGAAVERPENFIGSLDMINFYQDDPKKKFIFSKDIIKFWNFLTIKKNFPKISWWVVVGNPIEKSYDKIAKKIDARVVGIKEFDSLIDGKYYDRKYYEWINYYYKCSDCGLTKKKIIDISDYNCECGGFFKYYIPFNI